MCASSGCATIGASTPSTSSRTAERAGSRRSGSSSSSSVASARGTRLVCRADDGGPSNGRRAGRSAASTAWATGPGFRKVRNALGVTAFGVNAVVLPPGYVSGRHFHERQQELYFVLSGTIEFASATTRAARSAPAASRAWIPPPCASFRNVSESEDAVYVCVGGAGGYVGRDGRLPDAADDGRAAALPRRDPEGVAQQVRVGRRARRRSSSTGSCSPRSSTRPTTASSPTRSPRTAIRSTRWSASPSRRSRAA